jgi:hypothetical protein
VVRFSSPTSFSFPARADRVIGPYGAAAAFCAEQLKSARREARVGPVLAKASWGPERRHRKSAVSVAAISRVASCSRSNSRWETAVVDRTQLDATDRRAAAFQFEVPPNSLHSGLYTCQVSIIDAVAGKVAFPRLQLYVP